MTDYSYHDEETLGSVHIPHNWEYASQSARKTASDVETAQVGRLALQTDDKSMWRLKTSSPVAWEAVAPPPPVVGDIGKVMQVITDGDSDVKFSWFSLTPDTVYNNDTGTREITVDDGDYQFSMSGAYSTVFDVSSCTGTADGVLIQNGADYFEFRRSDTDKIKIEALVEEFNVNASVKSNFKGYAIFGSGSSSHSLSGDGEVVVDKLEVNSSFYADGDILLAEQKDLIFGSAGATNPLMRWSTAQTPDSLFLGLGSTSNHIVIAETGSVSHDFGHALATHPTVFVHSTGSVDANWISISCVNTVGTINAGTGAAINFPTGIDVDGTSQFDASVTFNSAAIAASSLKINDWVSPGTGGKINFGTGNDASLLFNTYPTNDSLYLGLDATSRTLVVGDVADISYNFAHGNQTNPTIFVHSASQSTSQWISISHDQTDGVINAGTNLKITPYTKFGSGTTSQSLSASGDVLVSGKLEVDGNAYFDDAVTCASHISMPDAYQVRFGNSQDVGLAYNTAQTVHAFYIGVSSDSRNVIIADQGNRATNFGHAQQTNPTIFIHSANTATDEWISFTHDQTDGVIDVGTGAVKFLDDIKLEANDIITDTTTGMKIGTATDQKLGFYNATPVTQRAKANYNNWAAFTDVVDALVALGLFDAA